MFARHPVEDYERWRSVYDGFEDVRQEHGVRDAAVYRAVEDGNDVTVFHDFPDADAAKAFADSDALRERMQEAGVAGQPEIWFVEQA